MAYLRYLDNAGSLKTRQLADEPVTLGRAASCQVVLESEMISREHAVISPAGEGRYSIKDLGSRNKTNIAGQTITETFLTPGDVIRLGDRIVEYLDDGLHQEKTELDFLTPDASEPEDCEWFKIKAPLSLTIQQLEELSRLQTGASQTARPEDIADTGLAQVMHDLAAERGFVALRGDSKRDLRLVAHRGLAPARTGSRTPVSQSFVYSTTLQAVAGRYPQSASHVEPKSGYATVALVAPLVNRGEIIGTLYVDKPASRKPFAGPTIQYIAAAGAQLGAMMAESARRMSELAGREGAAWMNSLRKVQSALAPKVAGNETFAVAHRSFAGRVRAGDLVDVVHVDDQRTAIMLIDAGGHGMPGLAQGAALRASIRGALAVSEDTLSDPTAVFAALNELVADAPSRQVIPCTFVGVDLTAGKIFYINAGGMPPVLMIAASRLMTLDQSSLVLGVDRNYTYQTTSVDLPETFRLVMYSDGFAEATNTGGEAMGNQRIHDELLQHESFGPVDGVMHQLSELWAKHLAGAYPDDDASMLAVGRGET